MSPAGDLFVGSVNYSKVVYTMEILILTGLKIMFRLCTIPVIQYLSVIAQVVILDLGVKGIVLVSEGHVCPEVTALAAVALSLTCKGENGACLAVTLTLRSGRIPAEELQTMRRAVEGAAGAQGSEIRIALIETAAKEDLPCV